MGWKNYSQSVSITYPYRRFYVKKPGVPLWLWRLVSLPDPVSHAKFAAKDADAKLMRSLEESL